MAQRGRVTQHNHTVVVLSRLRTEAKDSPKLLKWEKGPAYKSSFQPVIQLTFGDCRCVGPGDRPMARQAQPHLHEAKFSSGHYTDVEESTQPVSTLSERPG